MRYARDTSFDDLGNVGTTYGQEFWMPGETQVGTEWLPTQGSDLWNKLTNDNKGFEDVGMIFWFSVINLILAILPTLIACFKRICGDEVDKHENKNSALSGTNTFLSLCIGITGICAVKLNCKELLSTSVILVMILLVVCILYLLLALCGLITICCRSDGCSEAICNFLAYVLQVVWIVLAVAINLYFVIKAWPFCFGEGKSLGDTVEKMSDST